MQTIKPFSFGPLIVVPSSKPKVSRIAISRAFACRSATVRTNKLVCIVSLWSNPQSKLVLMARKGSAVARNRLRRHAQEYLRTQWHNAPCIVILRALEDPANISRAEIISCLQDALQKGVSPHN